MSGPQNHSDAHGADHGEHGASHATLRGYLTGFVLAAILTAIPFWFVPADVLGNATTTAIVITAFAAV